MGQTLNNIYDNVSYALNLHGDAMARLQEQVSTGARINRVSDDPSDAYTILNLNSQQRTFDNYVNRISEFISVLELSSTVVQDLAGELTEVRTRLTQVSSGIYNTDTRQTFADGINDILEHVVLLVNTKQLDQYLFAGGDTASPPYVVERTNGKITNVTYQGSLENRVIQLAPAVQSEAFYLGSDIFHSRDRSDPVFFGDTGAKVGTGTSNVTGDVWLTVIHDGSNYKISIDDGLTYVTVPAGGDTNQAVTDSRTGKVLYVDTTEISDTGLEPVRVTGTYDVFSILISIRDMLTNERGLSEAKLEELRSEALSSLEQLNGLLVQTQVSMGSKTAFLDNLKDTLININYDAEDRAAELEQADIAQIAVELSRRQVLYEMSLSIAARVMSMSLINFIR